jgi:pimeloyl-ACP methyl ester carboxylesterase
MAHLQRSVHHPRWPVLRGAGAGALLTACVAATAWAAPQVVDLTTRPGVTQRFVYLAPTDPPKAAAVLFAGGNGGLKIQADGTFGALRGNFLVRTRRVFVDQGLAVAVLDAPSDRPAPAFLDGFRQTPEHVEDVKAVIAWLRQKAGAPVWLVGTSRGTQSAAFVATKLARSAGGPDGLVLTSTILLDPKGRAVPMMPLRNVAIPVLVVHHEQDGCALCPYAAIPSLMDKLTAAPAKELVTVTGGESRGDPCGAFAHHGYYGQDAQVATQIAAWIRAH